MSKSYFMRCKSLHSLPKFTSTMRRIQVGNRQYVGILFVIPVIMTIQNHRFEIFTLVSEIHENVDLVIGTQNLFELEGVNRLMRFLCQFSKQVNTFLSKRKSFCKVQAKAQANVPPYQAHNQKHKRLPPRLLKYPSKQKKKKSLKQCPAE